MPRLSVYYVRAALVYLLLAVTFGGLLLANKGVPFWPAIWGLLPVHVEFALVGWVVQLAMGVAFWILPRFTGRPPRGDERWSWAAWALLNVGIVLVILQGFAWGKWLPLAGRALEGLAVLSFVIGNWRRAKPIGA